MLTITSPANTLARGLSYWKVELSSGKIITEAQVSFDFLRGTRNVDWHLDIIGAGESRPTTSRNIRALTLCTPQGDATLPILEPYTAFQLKLGTQAFLGSSEKIVQAHIIGRVDDRETGACTSVIWDVLEQRLYLDHMTSVKDFKRWREDVADLRALSAEVIGVRLL